MDLVRNVYDKLLAAGAVGEAEVYFEYDPVEQEFFTSNVAQVFERPNSDAARVVETLESLEAQNLIKRGRVLDGTWSTTGSQGQPYPQRYICTAQLA